MIIEKIYFSATDDIQLFGLLHKTEKENARKRVVLSVHGMTSNCLKKRENLFAEEYTDHGIDYFCFDNRGANIIEYYERVQKGKLITRMEAGTAYEKFEDCYYDIKGAMLMLLEKGYQEIYLQGHSYGSAKSVYTYNKMKKNMEIELLKHIQYVILLSIVDVPRMCRGMLGEKYPEVITEIKQMINEGKGDDLIKREYFLHPMSANNFLFFNQIGGAMDIVPFGAEKPNLIALENIECPLFMSWGKERDLISQKPEELEKLIRQNLTKPDLTIRFIDGTGHNYRYHEKETIKEVLKGTENFFQG